MTGVRRANRHARLCSVGQTLLMHCQEPHPPVACRPSCTQSPGPLTALLHGHHAAHADGAAAVGHAPAEVVHAARLVLACRAGWGSSRHVAYHASVCMPWHRPRHQNEASPFRPQWCAPVRRRSLPSPYAAMCTACRRSSLAIWSWIACQPVPSVRVALEEKLVWPPAPFQSPGMGCRGWRGWEEGRRASVKLARRHPTMTAKWRTRRGQPAACPQHHLAAPWGQR